MSERDGVPVPDRIRRSPTGRVPAWVLDEAMGKPVEPVPFRAPTSGHLEEPYQRRSGGRGVVRLAVALAVAGSLGGVVLYLQGERWAQRADVSAAAVAGSAPLGSPTDLSGQRSGPPAGLEELTAPRGVPPAVQAADDPRTVRFLQDAGDGEPVTWSPCRPIHYVTRPDAVPPRGGALLAEAVAQVSAATGLTFIHDGATSEAPAVTRPLHQPERYGDRWAPVLIAWASEAEVPDLAGDVAGHAGPVAVTTPSGEMTYLSGQVVLDVEIANAPDSLVRTVMLHELGHLVGLAHVDDPSQLMFEESRIEVQGFGPGDRSGLAALGRGPCQPDV